MKLKTTLLATVASLLFTGASFGGITGVVVYNDNDGAFQCSSNSVSYPNPVSEASLNIVGNQLCGPGHLLGNVLTDTPEDPTLTLANLIDNDTGYAWAGYQVKVFMNKAFTINYATLNAPAGWSLASLTAPVGIGGGMYYGQFTFAGTPAIAPGGQIDFTYQVSFAGSVSFTQEMSPIAVPEPTVASLLLGGLVLGLARRQRK